MFANFSGTEAWGSSTTDSEPTVTSDPLGAKEYVNFGNFIKCAEDMKKNLLHLIKNKRYLSQSMIARVRSEMVDMNTFFDEIASPECDDTRTESKQTLKLNCDSPTTCDGRICPLQDPCDIGSSKTFGTISESLQGGTSSQQISSWISGEKCIQRPSVSWKPVIEKNHTGENAQRMVSSMTYEGGISEPGSGIFSIPHKFELPDILQDILLLETCENLPPGGSIGSSPSSKPHFNCSEITTQKYVKPFSKPRKRKQTLGASPLQKKSEATTKIHKIILNGTLVVVTKENCAASSETLNFLGKRYPEVEITCLDESEFGENVMSALLRMMTGSKVIPHIFLGGQSIGSLAALKKLEAKGILAEKIKYANTQQ